MEKAKSFQTNGWITGYLFFKKEHCLLLNLEWVIDPLVKVHNIKLLQGNTRENICNCVVNSSFLGHKKYETIEK